MTYQTHHLKLMQMLDQHKVSCVLTAAWMERYFGLSETQVKFRKGFRLS